MTNIIKKSILIFIFLGLFISFDASAQVAPSSRSASSVASSPSSHTPVAALPSALTTANQMTANISLANNNQINQNLTVYGVPMVVSSAAISINTSGAILTGSVNPHGFATDAWFEVQNSGSGLSQNMGNGNSPTSLASYNLTGLSSHTTYNFRVVASNINGTTYGSWTPFTTLSNYGGGGGGGGYIYVTVATQNASNVSTNGALLNGTVYHSNAYTNAWFQYGTSSNLTSFSETSHTNTGFGNSTVPVAQNITGLNPNTTYYFRTIANSNTGTQTGTILSFKTKPTVITVINNQNIQEESDQIIIKEETPVDNSPVVETNSINNNADVNFFTGNNTTDLSANVLYGLGNFLPVTLFQWVLLIIILLAITIVSRRIYLSVQTEKEMEVSADHIENLPTE